MNQFPVDADAETIFLDDAWHTREDLARRIKTMIDQGDFAVARPSAALEQLTQTLVGVRTVAFKVTPDLADALNQHALRAGKTVGSILRETVANMLRPSASSAMPPPIATPPPPPSSHIPVPEGRITAPTASADGTASGIARDSEPTVEVSSAALEGRWFKQ